MEGPLDRECTVRKVAIRGLTHTREHVSQLIYVLWRVRSSSYALVISLKP